MQVYLHFISFLSKMKNYIKLEKYWISWTCWPHYTSKVKLFFSYGIDSAEA